VLGVSNGVTSVQAVEQLLQVGASVVGCDTGSVLYHPKLYILEGEDTAWVSIGSSNLTANGLYRNVESNLVLRFDLHEDDTTEVLSPWHTWIEQLVETIGEEYLYEKDVLIDLVESKTLINEEQGHEESSASSVGKTKGPKTSGKKLPLPPLPPPVPLTSSVLPEQLKKKPTSVKPAKTSTKTEVALAPSKYRFFAMTLSAFDCSHKTGTPGTPEVSIPEDAAQFFPPVAMRGRRYPDVYFSARVNAVTDTPSQKYRLWQRPLGSATGHADWRINIGHGTMDLTSDGGGDLLLVERVDDEEVPYEVWVVKPSESKYADILNKCEFQVTAKSAAGTKRYGLFE
jgi:hypothetical protein